MEPTSHPTRRPTVPAAEEILGGYFPVLDHGFVALVDYMGTDDSVERAARVSYGYGTRKVSATRGLIRYLRRHLHTTPSEMVEFKFHCAMPMFVARQWIRHRTACLAEGTEVYFDLPGAEASSAGMNPAEHRERSGAGLARRDEGAVAALLVRGATQSEAVQHGCVAARMPEGFRPRAARGRRQLYKLPVEEIWRRFQPTRNKRPDKQRNPFFRRDRVRQMRLRQVDEDTLAFQHTRIVDVYRNGVKPVFRMVLEDGKSIEATADHRFLFATGWDTLRGATGVRETGGRAVWRHGDYFVHVNGAAEKLDDDQFHYRTKLVRIARFEYVGERETYDLEVEGPHHNFVANGIVTHNSVNEYSGRYSLMPLLFYSPEHDQFSLQSATSNQGRAPGSVGPGFYREAIRRWEDVRARAAGDYGWLVGENVARELARIDLPLSTYTQWYWKIDLHNLLHFLTLRVDDHAQWEIQEYGRVMAGMVKRVAPLSYEAWVDYQVMGDKLSGGEIAALSRLLSADGDGVSVRDGTTLTNADLAGLGLSGREIRELKGKLEPREVPDYELDLATMRDPQDVAAEMDKAVPEVDRG